MIADAREFILGRQERDGRWAPRYWNEKEDAKRTALNTAFIARVLAMEKSKEAKADKDFAAAVGRSLDYLAKRIEEIDEPYSSALRLAVDYDKLEAKIGEEIICAVTAERVGHQGYGMMLAEIGLPPGADVDRESLERAAKESGWSLNHYDVLPDRVIAYLWPQAGGLKFSFKFKPRYGVKAQTAPSALYDYYNPEARVALAPSRFIVK